jgi:hypothetical protein
VAHIGDIVFSEPPLPVLFELVKERMTAGDRDQLCFELARGSRYEEEQIVRRFFAPRVAALAVEWMLGVHHDGPVVDARIGDRVRWR